MMRGGEGLPGEVHERVCGACALHADACELEPPRGCALFTLFPLVVQAILATESEKLADYQRAIRENVCSVCADAALDLTCELRKQVRCALDLYLAEVVAAVRQAAAPQVGSPLAVG